jgi:hypothetical protein
VPVAGAGVWRVAGDHLLVSPALRADPEAWRTELDPVIAELA